MRTVILTVVVCLILLVAGGWAFVNSGIYDVAAIHPDNPVFANIIHQTSAHSVLARAQNVEVPSGYDAPEKIAAGAKIYGQTCVVCHNGPGLEPSDIRKGLNPTPPDLFRAGRHPEPKVNYWFVSNGVKMTAMPGFSKSLSDEQIWSVVAFLNTAPGMSAADFKARTGVDAANPPAPVPSGT